jgi:hypothetical protein
MDGKGTLESPVSSIYSAKLLVKKLIKNTKSSITVVVHAGTYYQTETIIFDESDSGTSDRKVTYKVKDGDKVIISGGQPLNFQPLTDYKGYNLPETSKNNILVSDLNKYEFSFLEPLTSRGFANAAYSGIELFTDDQRMPLATYPNKGWLFIKATEDERKFIVPSGMLKQKMFEGESWAYGYWYYDWADQYIPIESFDETNSTITLLENSRYGLKTNARFKLLNILSELDRPGEWYLEEETGLLFLWPLTKSSSQSAILSYLDTPLFEIKNAENIVFKGFIFESVRGSAISVLNSKNIRITECEIKHTGTTGIEVIDGHENIVDRCTLYDIGGTGINILGGDRKSLTPSNHLVINNHINNFGVTLRTYQPAIRIGGVGNKAAHNHIHHAPHMAIEYTGNDHIIEFNNIHHVLLDTDDAGAIYTGRDWTARGHVVRWNYIHHSGPNYATKENPSQIISKDKQVYGTSLIYLDDTAAGTEATNNILHDGYKGILIGGGRDNFLKGNVFIGGKMGIWIDARGLKRVELGGYDSLFDILKELDYKNEPYSTKYPKLARMLEDEPHSPIGNVISGNTFVNVPINFHFQSVDEEILTLTGNEELTLEIEEEHLTNPSVLLKKLNLPLPPQKIGIQNDY